MIDPSVERDAREGPGRPGAVWRRFVAQVLDSFVLAGPAFVIFAATGVEVDVEAGEFGSGDRLFVAVGAIVVMVVTYQTLLVARRGATIGKAALARSNERSHAGIVPSSTRTTLRARAALPIVAPRRATSRVW